MDPLKFSRGLIPAVIVDHRKKDVLMVAYMSPVSFQKTLQTGETHFWSRSRKKLWRKGETSGHVQRVRAIYTDCDQDTLLIEVEQVGVACHTGSRSCFFEKLGTNGAKQIPSASKPTLPVLEALYQTISERKRHPLPNSYTSLLFEGGIDRILKKVGEEAGEFIISAKNRDKKAVIHETADLFYHLLVALSHHGISVKAVEEELQRRSSQSGLAEKRSRTRKSKKS
ncbi:MAG: bifunctional phosphoribosyl-AMP cyclohydrolase/phosphoribosyl-ATP diphosphatase HisIE [Candidatus Manganitrophaceae bacterium]|nr:MAG: bifunctional phosphoribosyl-AMP cyclohydrolase/phosphoribosyl-ATP diphosphatase HisIE [Candidatus Manganitrophaceae bacterium]